MSADILKSDEEYHVKLVASFLGIKFIPLPFVLGINNMNPKLIFSEKGIEYRSFILTQHVAYREIEKVDIFLAHKTTNLHLIKSDSIFSFVGNTNNKSELYRCLKLLKQKNCPLTQKAEDFCLQFPHS